VHTPSRSICCHCGSVVRRSRRGDQHHPLDPAGTGRRGDPPRADSFRTPNTEITTRPLELARRTEAEYQSKLHRPADSHSRHRDDAELALTRLREVVISDGNVFAELMSAAPVCSLGQITDTFFEVGSQYRRNV
jgi:hypothetical protein